MSIQHVPPAHAALEREPHAMLFTPGARLGWIFRDRRTLLAPNPEPEPDLEQLTAGITQLGEGLVAEAGSDPVGFAAVDMAGSIPLILVDPACQRRGIGTGLLAVALERIRAGGVADVTAASGGCSYIWPGIPKDLPVAVQFFASCGWRHSHDTLDLVTDLAWYRPPPGVGERAASTGVTVTRAASADLADMPAFEASAFPSWLRWFSAAGQDVLIARGPSPGPCC
jgi:GNAT superfamily N-acetyltransferase